MTIQIWVNIGSGTSLFPDSTLQLPQPCWVIIKDVLWHSPESNFTRGTHELISLTHWGRVTHICVSRLTITCSNNGLSPGRRQAIMWTNDGILSIGPLGTNFSENFIEILTFSFTKMRLKVSSAKWRPFCLGLNVLTCVWRLHFYIEWLPQFPGVNELRKLHVSS